MLSPTVALVPLPIAGFAAVFVICTILPDPRLSPDWKRGVDAVALDPDVFTYLT